MDLRFLALGLVVVAGLMTGMSDRGSAESDSASIWIQPKAVTVKSTDTAFVDIFADIPAPGVAEWWLDVSYDPEVLFADYCDPTGDDATNGSGCHPTATPGTIRASGYVQAGLHGRHKLARIPFTAIAPAGSQSEIDVVPAKFVDPSSSSLPAYTAGGLATVDGTGTNTLVTGVVFNDLDGDGLRNDLEPGLYREVRLTNDSFFRSTGTGGDGSYLLEGGNPGQYTIQAELNDLVSGICSDGATSHDPLWHVNGCTPPVEIEWEPTTARDVAVSLEQGTVAKIDFGARRRDIQFVRGGALLGTAPVPQGALVQAWSNGMLCGETHAEDIGANYNFTIGVLGDREMEGCTTAGDQVSFTLDGVTASQTFIWASEDVYRELDLTAMPNHAWYWVNQPASSRPDGLGIPVEALINGTVCGETNTSRAPPGFIPPPYPIGFGKLTVPSDSLQPGCGYSGATVHFLIDGQESEFTVIWQPGLVELDLPLPGMILTGDVNCNGSIAADDALLVLRLITRLDDYLPHGCPYVHNTDCDGYASSLDALHILRFVAGLPSRVPEGCPGVGA